jgi:hypothetical protein
MDIKGLIADHMGHFSVYDVPNVLIVVVAAACLALVLARWGAGQEGRTARTTALWGAAAALATAFVRSQLPVAVLVLAAAVLAGRGNGADRDPIMLSALVIGIGCGSGATIIVMVALVPYLLLARWALGKQNVG